MTITSLEPAQAHKDEQRRELATLGGGCFWCTQAVFDELEGVERVECGYSGGWVPNPTYRQVCTGTIGHAEVVQVTFAPKVISYRELLEVFFSTHDPTTLNRQGPDEGPQYRSVIFYHDDEQKNIAGEVIKKLSEAKVWDGPIVTEVKPFSAFYRAEEYHQKYFNLHGEEPYCRMLIAPKLKKFREHYGHRLKK